MSVPVSPTLATNSPVVSTAAACESVMTWASSAVLARKISGVATRPAHQHAWYVIPTSGQFAIRMTTRSPGCSPAASRPPASRRARPKSSVESYVTPSKVSCPPRCAACSARRPRCRSPMNVSYSLMSAGPAGWDSPQHDCPSLVTRRGHPGVGVRLARRARRPDRAFGTARVQLVVAGRWTDTATGRVLGPVPPRGHGAAAVTERDELAARLRRAGCVYAEDEADLLLEAALRCRARDARDAPDRR